MLRYSRPMEQPSITIISGPTSAGKSTFIEAHADRYDVVELPRRFDPKALTAGTRYAVHYNILNPYWRTNVLRTKRSVLATFRASRMQRAIDRGRPFDGDAHLARILSADAKKSAVVLVVPRDELERRVRARVEGELLVGRRVDYTPEEWLTILARVDLNALYRTWLAFLDARGVTYELFVSRQGTFEAVRDLEASLR
jgi:hypothetical protein